MSYANSLAFTSHLGSSDHKLQREKEARRPKPVIIMPLSSSSSSLPGNHQLPPSLSLPPSRKEILCQLCNVACSGAEVYAQHIKSEEHQRILRMNSDHRKRPNDRTVAPSMPLPEEFGMNFDKTRSFADVTEDSIGQEFVEEIRNLYGNIVRVVCNLCKVDIPNPTARRLHLQSQQHRMLCEQNMTSQGLMFGQDFRGGPKSSFGGTMLFGQELGETQQKSYEGGFGVPCFGTDPVHENNVTSESKKSNKETEDDECVRQKHSLVYPTTGDFRAVQKVSGSCDRWLKTIMNNLVDGSQQKLISSVVKVGSLAKGLLLHYDLSCDLLVLTRDWPTKSLVRTIYNQLGVLREKNTKDDQSEFALTISDGEDLITLENLWHPLVKCNILISSHSVSDAKEQDDSDDRLGRDLCLRHLNFLEQTKWFQTKAFPLPSCVLVVRAFKDLRHCNREFASLTDEVIERLVASTIKCLDGRGGPGMILRKSLEFLASGFCKTDDEVPKNEGENEKAAVNKCKDGEHSQGILADEVAEYLSYLTPQEKQDITKLAQHLLSQKMREILYSQKSDPKADQPAAKDEESKGKCAAAEGSTLNVMDDTMLRQEKELAGESGTGDLDECNQLCVKKLKVEQ